MPRPKRSESIISKMEALALELVAKATSADNIDLKMDIFRTVADWVKIKSKLEDDDGGAIAEYKRRLAGEDTGDKKRRAFGGSRLDALKSNLPSASNGDPISDSNDAISEDVAAA